MINMTIKQLIADGIIEEPMDGNHGEIHPTSKDYVCEGIPFIMASDVENGIVNYDTCKYISIETAGKLKKGFAKQGDVLLTHKATIGRTAIIDNLSVDYIVLTPQVTYYRILDEDVLDKYYLKYFFDSPQFQYILKKRAGAGSTRAYIGIQQQTELPISFPDIEKQKKIGGVLSILDIKIKNNNAINIELEAMARKIYNYWFLQFDFPDENGKPYKSSGGKMVWNEMLKREIPEGWSVSKVNDILANVPKTKKYKTNEYKLGSKYPIIDQSTEYICGYTDNENDLLDYEDCIVFGDHTKCVKYINFSFARGADGTQIIISSNENISNYLLYRQILDMDLLSQGYSRYFKFLKDKFVIIPRKKVTEEYMKHMQKSLDKMRQVIIENRELESLRDFLLPLLMNGQVGFKEC